MIGQTAKMKIHKSLHARVSTAFLSFFAASRCPAQRYSQERTYDIVGLADGDEIIEALQLGIPLLVIGFLIAYFSMWRKTHKEKQSEKGSTIGCIGIIIIGIGFIVLLPLWTWVEAIGATLVGVVFGLAIIFALAYYIYEALKK